MYYYDMMQLGVDWELMPTVEEFRAKIKAKSQTCIDLKTFDSLIREVRNHYYNRFPTKDSINGTIPRVFMMPSQSQFKMMIGIIWMCDKFGDMTVASQSPLHDIHIEHDSTGTSI